MSSKQTNYNFIWGKDQSEAGFPKFLWYGPIRDELCYKNKNFTSPWSDAFELLRRELQPDHFILEAANHSCWQKNNNKKKSGYQIIKTMTY